MGLELFREDLDKRANGSPCYIDEMTFYIARMGTKKAQSEIIEIREKLYGLFPKPTDIDETEVIANWLAYYGVIGWDCVIDGEDGEDIKFSKSEARKLFLNESYWLSLNQALFNHAHNYEHYLQDKAEKDAEEIKKP